MGLPVVALGVIGLVATNPDPETFEHFAGDRLAAMAAEELCNEKGLPMMIRLVITDCHGLVLAQRGCWASWPAPEPPPQLRHRQPVFHRDRWTAAPAGLASAPLCRVHPGGRRPFLGARGGVVRARDRDPSADARSPGAAMTGTAPLAALTVKLPGPCSIQASPCLRPMPTAWLP